MIPCFNEEAKVRWSNTIGWSVCRRTQASARTIRQVMLSCLPAFFASLTSREHVSSSGRPAVNSDSIS